jgi:simple sugar transport system substrate-binding protein
VSDNERVSPTSFLGGAIGRGDFLKLAGLSAGAATLATLAPFGGSARAEQAGAPIAGWAKGIKIIFEAGGNPGDAFAQIVINGAQQAAQDLGCHLDILHAGWDSSTMVQQYRQAIATAPDGLAMMGHPGDAALMPIAQQAHEKGVLTEYVNVDLPQVRAAFGGGYIGADLYKEGQGLAKTSIKEFGLKSGDKAVVFGNFGMPGIAPRDLGIVETLEKEGVRVTKVVQQDQFATNPSGMTSLVVGAIGNVPDVKLVSFSGGQFVGASGIYLKAAGKTPGQVKVIGFDILPAVITAMQQGWAHLVAVQEPYLQGYLPVLSLCLQKKWRFAPLTVDTGTGTVSAKNADAYSELVKAGIAG